MADLISQPNYAAQISQAAAIPGNIAGQWANASLTNQQSQQINLENQLKQAQLPLAKQYIDMMKQAIANRTNNPDNQQFNQAAQIPGQSADGSSPTPASNLPGAVPSQDGNPQSQPSQGAGSQGPVTETPAGTHSPSGGSVVPTNHIVANQQFGAEKFASDKYMPQPTTLSGQDANDYALFMGAKGAAGIDMSGYAEGLKDSYAMKAETANAQKQIAARKTYSIASDVANAPSGTRLDVLRQQTPSEYEAFMKQPGVINMTPQQQDAAAKQFAEHVGLATFRYSGHTIQEIDRQGFARDENGQRVVGGQQVSFSPQEVEQIRAYVRAPSVEAHLTNGTTVHVTPAQYRAALQNPKQTDAIFQDNPMHYENALETDLLTDPTQGQSVLDTLNRGPTAAPPNQIPASGSQPVTGPSNQGTATARPASPAAVTAIRSGAPVPTPNNTNASAIALGGVRPANLAPNGPNELMPHLGSGGGLGGPSPEAQGNYDNYKPMESEFRNYVANHQTEAANALTTTSQIMNYLKQSNPGPLSKEWIVPFQSMLRQAFGSDPENLGPLSGNPAAWSILNKLTNSLGVEKQLQNISDSGAAIRASGMMAKMSIDDMSANASLLAPAILDMTKLMRAESLYTQNELGPELDAWTRAGGRYDKTFVSRFESNPLTQKQDYINRTVKHMDEDGNVKMPKPGSSPDTPIPMSVAEWDNFHPTSPTYVLTQHGTVIKKNPAPSVGGAQKRNPAPASSSGQSFPQQLVPSLNVPAGM